jgi:hypothetical protein
MARGGREVVEWPKTCPGCGRKGIATYEEAESPPHRGRDAESYDRTLINVTSPFKIERALDTISCECGREVT